MNLRGHPLSLLFNLLLSCCFLLAWRISDVVAGGRPAVLRAGRAAGTWPCGFRCSRENRQGAADGPEPAADAGGSEPAGRAGLLPRQAQVGGPVPGEPEPGAGGYDEPRTPGGGGRVPHAPAAPAERPTHHT